LNNIHFLLLDLEWSAESYTASQQEWLEKQLASIPPEDWTIVMGHGYYYSSGTVGYGWHWWDNQETIQRLAPLFEKYDVDLVFSGHNHIIELLQKSNVTYVICGAFGGKPMPERIYVSPYSIWYRSGQYAFVDVTIDPKAATIIFRDPSYNAMKTFTVAPMKAILPFALTSQRYKMNIRCQFRHDRTQQLTIKLLINYGASIN